MDVKEIISGCKAQNSISQKKLYDMYCKQMYPICLRYCKDTASASAALQAAFLKVFNNIEKLQDETKIGGWIRKIVVRSSLDQLKKDASFRFEEIEDYKLDYQTVNSINHSTEGVLKYLEALPPGYKLILTLNVIDEMPHKEIATLLGITEGSSRSQLFKAKRMLKKIITTSKVDTNT